MSEGNLKKVLVIDDDPASIAFLEIICKTLGLEMHSSNDPSGFIQLFRDQKPDLCLVDLNIGKLAAGFSLIQAIRKIDQNTPLFIISGASDKNSIAHAIEVGANDYITKPIDKEILASKLDKYITNEDLKKALPKSRTVPRWTSGGRLDLDDFEFYSMDEFGVTLFGPHLLAKGAIIKLTGPLFLQITDSKNPVAAIVSSTWVDVNKKGYWAYCEFNFRGNKRQQQQIQICLKASAETPEKKS